MAFENVYGQVRNDFINRQATLNDQAAMQKAGNSLAGGDYSGAANALYKAGDLQNGMTVANAGSAQRQAEAQATQRFVQGVKNLVASGKAGDPNDPATYQRAFQAGAQYAPQMGIDPAHLQQFKTLYDRDPQGALDFADAMAKKELQFFQTDSGILAGDKGTGNVSMAYKLPGKPDWKEIKNPDGSTTFVDVNDPANQMGGNAAAPASPKTQQAGAPRGVRNNNPLNISTLPNGQTWNGQTGADGQYAVFASPEAGMAAADKNLQSYATRHGINTIAGVISRWAPPGSNDTASYIQTVAKDLGVNPNQPLNLADAGVRQRLLQSMSKVELGPAAAGTLQGGAGGDVLRVGRRVAGSAAQVGEEDSMTSDARDANAMRYVQTGQMPAMGMGKSARADRVAILNRAAELMKKYDIKPEDWATGLATFKVTQGTLGQVNKVANLVQASENTVIKNADLALSLAPKGAGPTGSPVFDRWIQAGRKNIAGDADVAAFNAALGTVADEYAKVMTTSTGTGGAGTSDAARHEAYSRLNSAMNIGQLQKVIGTMKQEMANRTDSLRQQQDALTAQLRSVGGAPAQPAAAPVAAPAAAPAGPRVRRFNPATGKLEG